MTDLAHSRLVETLAAARRALILSHVSPDGDTLGSSLALASLLQRRGAEAVVYNQDPIPYFLRFLPGGDRIRRSLDENQPPFDCAVFVDGNERHRFGSIVEQSDSVMGTLLVVDHHLGDCSFAAAAYVDPHRAATGELVLDIFDALGVEPTADEALCLYTAIATDTGFFRYSNTTTATFSAASRLVAAGVTPSYVHFQVNEQQPPNQLRMLGRVLDTLELDAEGRAASLYARLDWERDFAVGPEVYEGFVQYGLSIHGVQAALFVREIDGGTRCKASLRSRGALDCAAVARALGGGGHRNAAGLTLAMPLAQARQVLRSALCAAFFPDTTR